MTPLMSSLACVMALAQAFFLWRGKIRLLKEGLLLFGFFVISCVFTLLVGSPNDPQLEHYPLQMLALCLCFSTTSLPRYRRRYLVMAQALWFWVVLFGGISLAYRGIEFPWARALAILALCCSSTLLSRISKEMEFCLMVFWLAIWILF